MKSKIKRAVRITLTVGGIAFLIALLCNIIPFVGEKELSAQSRAWLDELEYTAEETGPDRVTLIESTWEAYGVRAELIRAAEETLDIVYYAMDSGESADAFLGEVVAAADRGVEVRLITDGKMGPTGSDARGLKALAGHENITWQVYNPFNIRAWTWQSVLHDKFIIADGTYLLLGGRNIGDRYFNPESYTGPVTDDRDVLVWLEGEDGDSVLPQAEDYMELLWSSEDMVEKTTKREDRDTLDEYIAAAGDYAGENPQFFQLGLEDYLERTVETNRITLLYNPIHTAKKEPWVAYGVYRMAEMAGEEIWVQTPYSTGNGQLLSALDTLTEDCPVYMVTNSMASSPNLPAYSNYSANRQKFLDTGVTISEYQSTDSIHGKSVVVDGRLTAVGSLNMDDRSFYLDTETMLIIDSEAFGQEIMDALKTLEASCLVVGADGTYMAREGVEAIEASTGKRAAMWIASLGTRLVQFAI